MFDIDANRQLLYTEKSKPMGPYNRITNIDLADGTKIDTISVTEKGFYLLEKRQQRVVVIAPGNRQSVRTRFKKR